MDRHAIIEQNGSVSNIVVWDGETIWSPPAGTTAVLCADEVSVGWSYSNGVFSPPQVPQ